MRTEEDSYQIVTAPEKFDAVKKALVDRAVDAVKLLDPANERSMPELIRVLKAKHWRVRGEAFEALAKVPTGPLRFPAGTGRKSISAATLSL